MVPNAKYMLDFVSHQKTYLGFQFTWNKGCIWPKSPPPGHINCSESCGIHTKCMLLWWDDQGNTNPPSPIGNLPPINNHWYNSNGNTIRKANIFYALLCLKSPQSSMRCLENPRGYVCLRDLQDGRYCSLTRFGLSPPYPVKVSGAAMV